MSAEEKDDVALGNDHSDHSDHSEHSDHDDHDPALDIGPTPAHGYWRTLAELEGNAKLQENGRTNREFPPGAGEHDRPIDPLSRRNFFQLMGASMALAGVGACRYEKEEIIPLARRPEDQTPGVTTQYATVYDLGGVATPLLATSYEGRPIHLEGNAEHPWHGGGIVAGTQRHAGISTFVQASILHLYDPDRSKGVTHEGKGSTIDAFRTAVATMRKSLGKAGRILAESSSSPTLQRLKLALGSTVQWHEYEAVSYDNERAGNKLAFGRPLRSLAKLDKCTTIVTLDADIFIDHPAAHRYSRDFAKSRRMDGSLGVGKMNRLWSVEAQFTHTGAMADHRLAMRSEHVLPFAKALDVELGGGGAKVESSFLGDANVRTYLSVLAQELADNKRKGLSSIVVAGRRQPAEVHAIVAHINATLNATAVLDYYEDADQERQPHLASITALAKDLEANKVQTLIILGGNPVYDAPADLNFGALLAKVPESVHLSEYVDETSKVAKWHVNKAHFLEAWNDARTLDGTYTLAQPLIAPMFGAISSIELLALLVGNEESGEALVKKTHAELKFSPLSWRAHVAAGFVADSARAPAPAAQPNLPAAELSESQKQGFSKRKNGDIEVTFAVSSFSFDGRFANNAWLQETPDFLSKVTWDNYALVGPETAQICAVENDTMIRVAINGKTLDLPCYTIPGQAAGTITLVLGGGRTAAGKVGGDGDRKVGFDTNKVRTTTGFDIGLKATVTSVGDKFELASVQEHWDIRSGLVKSVTSEGIAERLPLLIRETTAAAFVERPDWRAEPEEEFFNDLNLAGNTDKPEKGGFSLFKEKDYTGHRWGMAIDLSTCTGCNSCTVACQSENNIPVVGKQEVMNNREMSWMRIDRYFAGSPEDPQVVHQPVGCQHCEQAPCEQVCPVGATTHSDEGLNDMAYNRCIGTRYCANNCPYKVRRFNFLDWNKEFREARNKVRRLLFNPDVTVRMRGVMEKCTYCVQRIQNAKIKQKAEHRAHWPEDAPATLEDGAIVTACQAACPTEAIVFGDLSDKDSRIAKLADDRRSYGLLPETYTKPRTRFLARVRNPNPKMPKTNVAAGGHE
ncbi:MAG: TAT-variant-translocated molybdopterin oxidoreductase [Proteobacteria bacterium]|nr:TAT-variant-translocated molybdopterin oxidoreductase [Pseudomonadota bacterium]